MDLHDDNDTIVVIIQARMGSSRLPGKVLRTLKNKTVLGHILTRIKKVIDSHNVIVATTENECDNPVVTEAEKYGVNTFRGSEDNVLERYYFAALKFKADIVVRITSDCPLIDPYLLTKIIERFKVLHVTKGLDYLSNTLDRTYPRGLDVEVFTFNALRISYESATKLYEKEHVTPYIYFHPELFNIDQYKDECENHSAYRWTLDTEEDWKLISELYDRLYKEDAIITTSEIFNLLEKFPELNLINAHVEQKPVIN